MHTTRQPQEIIPKLGQESWAYPTDSRQIHSTFRLGRSNCAKYRVAHDQEGWYSHLASNSGSPRDHCGEPRVVIRVRRCHVTGRERSQNGSAEPGGECRAHTRNIRK